MTAEPLFLGIDGGGSKCRARLCGADRLVLGEGQAGAANIGLGLDVTFREIHKATKAALAHAGLSDIPLSTLHAGAGLAGMPLQAKRDELGDFPHPFASFDADTDAYTACLGAHDGADGSILIVGTGTCGVIIAGGAATYVGGWGLVIGDEGSGAYLGRDAVRRALREHDGVFPASRIGRAILEHFDSNAEELVSWAASARPGDYGKFVPVVIDHAQAGDAAAEGLMRETGEHICLLIEALVAKGAPSVALVGGLAEPIQPWLPERIRSFLVEPKGDPLDGALMLARRRFDRAKSS